MNDLTQAPEVGAGEPVTVITPADDVGNDLSITQAAKALAAARHKPKEQTAESAETATAEPELAVEANAAPLDEAPSEVTEEADPAEVPPIEPPRSWTKEAKEQWQSLPRNTQEYLAQREQERDREVRRSQNEAAEKLKGLTAKEQQVEQARQQYEAKLPALMQTLLDTQAAQFSDIKTMADVERMAQEDPFRKIQWDTHQQKLQAVAYEAQQAEHRKTQDQQTNWANHVQKENELAIEHIPELANPEKAKELTNRVASELLPDLGFSREELNDLASGKEKLSIYDHRIQRLLFSALKLADINKAKTAVVAKPVPQVQRPGVSRPSGAAASEEIQALTRKLESTGSLKDAQALRAAQARLASRRAS